MPSTNSHGERIVALETGQQALQSSLQKLADIVSEQADMQTREHGATRREIGLLGDKVGAVGKPNYGVIISACGLVLLLVGAVLSPLYFQLQANKDTLEKLAEAVHIHEMLPSHPVSGTLFDEREKARAVETELRDRLNQTQHALLRQEVLNQQAKP